MPDFTQEEKEAGRSRYIESCAAKIQSQSVIRSTVIALSSRSIQTYEKSHAMPKNHDVHGLVLYQECDSRNRRPMASRINSVTSAIASSLGPSKRPYSPPCKINFNILPKLSLGLADLNS